MASSFSQAVSSDGAGGGAAAVPAVEGAVLATWLWELEEEVEVVLVAVPDTAAAVVTAAAVDPDAAAAAVVLAAGCCWILCLTTRLAVPSFNFFMKFQASILDIRVQSVLLTEMISSPTFNVPFLSAAPPRG